MLDFCVYFIAIIVVVFLCGVFVGRFCGVNDKLAKFCSWEKLDLDKKIEEIKTDL